MLQKIREDLALEKVGLRTARALPPLAQTLEEWAQTGAAADQITTEAVENARAAYLSSKGRVHRLGQEGEWDLDHTMAAANKVVQNLGSVVGWAVRRGLCRRCRSNSLAQAAAGG